MVPSFMSSGERVDVAQFLKGLVQMAGVAPAEVQRLSRRTISTTTVEARGSQSNPDYFYGSREPVPPSFAE